MPQSQNVNVRIKDENEFLSFLSTVFYFVLSQLYQKRTQQFCWAHWTFGSLFTCLFSFMPGLFVDRLFVCLFFFAS